MEFRGFGRSTTGNVRSMNEDRYWVGEEYGVFVVADGVGGKQGGERASAAVVDGVADHAEELARLLREADPASDRRHRMRVHDFLNRVVGQINTEVYEQGDGEMGSTCEILALCGGAGFISHVGDSRTYLFRDGEAYQLTDDHTFAEKLRRQGRLEDMPDGDMREHYEHVLTRSIGGEPEVDVDTLFVDVQPEDRFLLCTDGVSDVLADELLRDSMEAGEVDEFADRVVQRALDAGSADNVTSLAVAASEGSEELDLEESPVDTVRKVSFLEQVDLFKNLDERELMKILRILYKREFEDGEVIIERSDEAGEMFMLLEGEVTLSIDGQEVARLEPGTHFGEMALFGEGPRSADAVAKGDVVLLAVPSDQFRRLVELEDVQLGNKILRNLLEHASRRIRETTLELLKARDESEGVSNSFSEAQTLRMEAVDGADEE